MATRHEQDRLLDALQKAVTGDVTDASLTRPAVCAVCESEIDIGTSVLTLPGPKRLTFVVCADCFNLFRLCPGPRPME
jgi:hypothetical protein